MYKLLILAIILATTLSGCNKQSSPQAAAPTAKPADALEAQLQKLTGNNAKNCGRVAPNTEVKAASDCAMESSAAKRPFYVGYELPDGQGGSITIALAGAGDGKLYALNYNPKGWQVAEASGELSEDKKIATTNCPAALRVAQSGRVTCFPPPNAMGGGGANPHGGMAMPGPGGGATPHGGGMMAAPPGSENPHGAVPTKPGMANPHGDKAPKVPPKTSGT
jgi:hypothetical protein